MGLALRAYLSARQSKSVSAKRPYEYGPRNTLRLLGAELLVKGRRSGLIEAMAAVMRATVKGQTLRAACRRLGWLGKKPGHSLRGAPCKQLTRSSVAAGAPQRCALPLSRRLGCRLRARKGIEPDEEQKLKFSEILRGKISNFLRCNTEIAKMEFESVDIVRGQRAEILSSYTCKNSITYDRIPV